MLHEALDGTYKKFEERLYSCMKFTCNRKGSLETDQDNLSEFPGNMPACSFLYYWWITISTQYPSLSLRKQNYGVFVCCCWIVIGFTKNCNITINIPTFHTAEYSENSQRNMGGMLIIINNSYGYNLISKMFCSVNSVNSLLEDKRFLKGSVIILANCDALSWQPWWNQRKQWRIIEMAVIL